MSVQIIAAQEEMLRKERELEEARKKLAQIRQQQYKFLPSELREDNNWLFSLATAAVWSSVKGRSVFVCEFVSCLVATPELARSLFRCVVTNSPNQWRPFLPWTALTMSTWHLKIINTTLWNWLLSENMVFMCIVQRLWPNRKPECDMFGTNRAALVVCLLLEFLFFRFTNCSSSSYTFKMKNWLYCRSCNIAF